LGERRVRNAEVRGSTPLGSTSVFTDVPASVPLDCRRICSSGSFRHPGTRASAHTNAPDPGPASRAAFKAASRHAIYHPENRTGGGQWGLNRPPPVESPPATHYLL